MQVTRKVSETINRGVTAVAMTVAIATIYGAMATEGQITQGDVFRHQIQTVFKQDRDSDVLITQGDAPSQESLTTLLPSSHGNTYGHP